jgi:serine/threonine protein phosphatase PrpC
MLFRIHAITHAGMKRRRNEDAFFITDFARLRATRALLMVADGMGGHSAGDEAARITAECFENAAHSIPPESLAETAAADFMLGAAASANRAIAEHVQRHPQTHGMGATVVAALLCGSGCATVVWLGDSRAYLIRDSRPALLTSDHSVVNRLVARGVITPQAAQHHPDRHLITRALGVGAPDPCDIAHSDLRPGDILLLCSDGLTSAVSDGSIALAASMHDDPQSLCAALVQAANDRGGPDNITVAAAFCLND